MKNVSIGWRAMLVGFSYMAAGLTPVWADDTEIYFGGASGGAAPNILLVLDTSGSMNNTDGDSVSRLDEMKEAMRSIITDANNVNIGLMRFNRPGGPVLYPVSPIDEIIPAAPLASSESIRIIDGNNDGVEFLTSNAVVLNGAILNMVKNVDTSIEQFLQVAVSHNDDDAEERVSDGNMYRSSSDIEMPYDGSTKQLIGVRFNSVAIPTGATILNASLDFVVKDVTSGTVNLLIEGELVDSGRFSNTDDDISDRTEGANSVAWEESNSAGVNDVMRTPDLASIVQEIVDDGAWASGTGMTFLIKKNGGSGSNFLRFKTHDNSASKAPKLNILYQEPGGGTEDVAVALRFIDVDVPKGVTISSADIEFTVAQSSAGTSNLAIEAELIGDSPALETSASNITTRTRTSPVNKVLWPNLVDWTTVGGTQTTPSLQGLVSELTSQADWCGGNAITFIITGSDGNRLAAAAEAGSEISPKLTINYDPETIPDGASCRRLTANRQIINGSDDIEESSTGSISTGSSDLEFTTDGSQQKIGLRFTNLIVPQGATINTAYLEFVADDSPGDSNDTAVNIAAFTEDNAPAFENVTRHLTDRKTAEGITSAVTWSITDSWSAGEKIRSAEIKTIVSTIISRSGWASGNDMAFLLDGSDSDMRRAVTFNESPSGAARLVIKFQDDGSLTLDRTVRDELLDTVDQILGGSGTPIQDVMYEAALYYRGEAVDYGKYRGTRDSTKPVNRVSHEASMVEDTFTINRPAGCTVDDLGSAACAEETISNGTDGAPTYQSPITLSCQKNHIILLTDGQANNPNSEAKIKTMIGETSCADSGGEACVPELTQYLNTTDQSDGSSGGDNDVADTQTVTTHTIGFNFSSDWLRSLATTSTGGGFYEADSITALKESLEAIVSGATDSSATFVTPVAAVNSFNRIFNRNEAYFSVFRPEETAAWLGNLKKYKIKVITDDDGNKTINFVDQDDEVAIDSNGFFAEGTRSFWSATEDGAEATEGGAGSLITDHSTRTVYTYTGGYNTQGEPTGFGTLSNSANEFATDNAALTAALMGVGSGENDIIDWARGKDLLDQDGDTDTAETRTVIADPLHSQAVAITYGGTESAPDTTLYITTNAGFLHAIDADDGSETFSFIPQELLPTLNSIYTSVGPADHIYGLDSPISSWVKDVDVDGVIESSDGDRVILYFGMRRGGRNYYAVDVTSRSEPKLLWAIQGGSTSGFANLGQSWAQPIRTKIAIKIGATVEQRDVLVISGGYDAAQDDTVTRSTDSMGAAIYIVDALTGEKLWSADDSTFADMDYSIPATMSVADTNGDSLADLMVIGDMGGQVWRFDIHAGQPAATLVTGGVIADLGGDAADSNRRFYHSPSLFIGESSGYKWLGITIGSGYRAHPLSQDADDRFYMIKQADVYSAPLSYSKLTTTDLYDATDNDVGEEVSGAQAALDAKSGWYINFSNNGEKVLSKPLVFQNEIFFNTYEPKASGDACIVTAGTNRSYGVNTADGSPLADGDDAGSDITETDRSKLISSASFIDSQSLIILEGEDNSDDDDTPDGTATIGRMEGTGISDTGASIDDLIDKTFWYEE